METSSFDGIHCERRARSQRERIAYLKSVGVRAPQVTQYIQQLVVQNNVVKQGNEQEDPHQAFFHQVADTLVAAVRGGPQGLQLIEGKAVDGEVIEDENLVIAIGTMGTTVPTDS